MNLLSTKIGLNKLNNFIFTSINKSIQDNYNINGDINLFNPIIMFFSNFYKENYQLNYSNKLLRLYKKGSRIDIIGYKYKALIKNGNKTYFTNIFIKEIPLLSYNSNIIDDYCFNIDYCNYRMFNYIYNANSPANIEIFITYLTSKITELNICPSFCINYGCYLVNMKKKTYMVDKRLICNECKYYEKNGDYFIENNNIPTYLLAIENIDYDFEFLYNKNLIDYNLFTSIIFQCFSAIIITNNTYYIKHNDLHIGNIMLKNTNQKYLYYTLDDIIYKIPTFGFIVKIIDWGRATCNIDNICGDNQVFNFDGDCFGQYIFNKLGSSKKNINNDFNRWSDMVLVSHNILNKCTEFRYTKMGRLLLNIITDTNNTLLDINKFDWSIYKKMSRLKFNIKPRNIIKNKIFIKYKINSAPKNTHLYNINY
tara:strand:+ start:659 stop:1930 length:1272 start_codon:yes stop_codon:yes gene_type:complete